MSERAAFAESLAHWAMERILADRPGAGQVATKTNAADWVTETDLAVERHVRDAIHARFPDDAVVGEEFGADETHGAEQTTWYVDPVDGTTNFVHALPLSTFSLCVNDAEGPLVGVVADPYRREILSAVRGGGAFLNGAPVTCTETTTLVGGIFLTELTMQSFWEGQARLMAELAALGCVTRILGTNALSLASVGAGRASATIVGAYNRIDCQAGTLISQEAGALVRSRSGAEEPVLGEGILCAAPGVIDELYERWVVSPAA